MTKFRLNQAATTATALFPTAPDPQSDPLAAEMTRRGFLFSLGALALSACGGGAGTSQSAQASPRLLGAMSASGAAGGAFVHPGLLHTEADFQRMALKFNTDPWKGSWDLLIANSHASLKYKPAPVPIVYRGKDGVHGENYSRLFNDTAAAYACALRWKVSGDSAYADKAVQILNAWSSTLTGIGGSSDRYLAAGLYGYELANAGEILRTYGGWAGPDFVRFQALMRNVFYPMNHDFLVRHNNAEITHYWANWDLCNMASIMAIGVLCDDQALFDEAVTYFKSGAGNGAAAQAVYYVHPGYLGQWQETGRDQGHNLLGIALMGPICEMAWNQGVDLYGYDNNRFLMGAEYAAKANLIESGASFFSVPYVPYKNIDVTQPVLSTVGQGGLRPCWALVYNHYVNRKGLAAPYSKRFAQVVQPEGGGGNYGPNSGGFDQLGYGTLTCTLDPIAAGAAPSGLSAYVSGGDVILSWWGSAYATGYTVKRAREPHGPYTSLRSGITDLLSHTDRDVPEGSWYYIVTADTPAGESAPSNQALALTGLQLHARLRFDEGSGSSAVDSSGNGHSATLSPGGATWAAGRRGHAVALDGSTGYVSLQPDIMAGIGDFSITARVYWNAARNGERVFDLGSGTGHYMMLTPCTRTGVLRFAMTVNGPSGEKTIDAASPLPVGQWVHVAVTLSGRLATLYVDGVAVGSNPDMFLAPFRLQDTSRSWIGRSQFANDPLFNGLVDDFCIYRGALEADEVDALANGPQHLRARPAHGSRTVVSEG
jgi:hypothetical protein